MRTGSALTSMQRKRPRPRRSLAAVFVALLLVVLLGGYAIGRSAPPTSVVASAPLAPFGHDHAGASDASALVGGLSVSDSGLTLVPATTMFTAGLVEDLRFRIVGFDGTPVLQYVDQQDKPLHLVVVRSDLSGYQHLHPRLAPDGTWSVPLLLPTAGMWRAFVDFVTTTASGSLVAATLGVNLSVAGDYHPAASRGPASRSVVDGYTVTLEGTPQVNVFTLISVLVSRAGQPVTDLQRHLGAYGHLVILREADLGYMHVHPGGGLANGAISFRLAAPSPGSYRAYFEFQVEGKIRTAELTLVVPHQVPGR